MGVCERLEACAEVEEPEQTLRLKVWGNLSNACGITLFVLGVLGCCRVLSPLYLGSAALGLSATALLFNLAAGQVKRRKLEICATASVLVIPIVLGTLGVLGYLSSMQMGLGLSITFGLGTCHYCNEMTKKFFRHLNRDHSLYRTYENPY